MKRFSVRYPSSSSITTRFILTFSLLFVAIFSISIWIFIHGLPGSSFSGWFGDEKNQAIRTLNSLADMQKTRLLQMFDHLRQDARLLAQDHFMREKLETLFSDHLAPQDALNPWPSNDPYGPYLEAWLREFQSQYSFYQAIHIVRIDTGQAILSTQPKIVNQILLDPVFSARILATRQDYIGGFAPSATPTSFLVGSPIFLAQENPAAVVVLVVSLQQFLQPVQSTAIGPWHSMETILVNERGVNLFRPGPPKNFAYHTPGSSDSVTLLPSRIAASGQEGFIETKDQNNVSVLAGYRHIRLFSEWRWGLVIQIGRDDLLQPMSTAYEFAWAIGFVSTAGFVIVAFILTRRLTHPLRQLTEAAHRLTAGQRHVRSQHQGKDEVGVLAKAFDTMADEVARTLDHLERTVTHRTVALAQELEIRKQQQREQQSIEMFLKESEQRYRSLVDTMTAGVAVYEAVEEGQDFIIRDINRMGEHLTQLEKKDVIGQLVTKVFPSVKEFGLFDVFQRVYQTAIPANHPMTICSHHRLKQWFENRIYKLPSGEIVAIFDDI
ncbi:MAG TPA: HAMP domain-containing protein, partial [Magnetococcales bacterium]|nr:HAMP domain-containing protein [Magnetococcales bacterium]